MKRCDGIMTRDPISCHPLETVAAAAERMARAKIGALPVVDGEEDWLVGILTHHDIETRVVDRELDPWATRVRAAMTHDVVTCLPDDEIYEANVRMEEHQIMRLPVIDEDGRLVGIVTRSDLTWRVDSSDPFAEFLEEVHAED